MTAILETRVHRSAIENIASTIRTICDITAVETFTLVLPFDGENNVQYPDQWRALEDALVQPDGRSPRAVKIRLRIYRSYVSMENQEHFPRTMAESLPRLDERGILDVIL